MNENDREGHSDEYVSRIQELMALTDLYRNNFNETETKLEEALMSIDNDDLVEKINDHRQAVSQRSRHEELSIWTVALRAAELSDDEILRIWDKRDEVRRDFRELRESKNGDEVHEE